MHVAIYVRGGNVCEVLTDNPEIVVTIVDFDKITEEPEQHPYDADVDIVENISKEIAESLVYLVGSDMQKVQRFRALNDGDAS